MTEQRGKKVEITCKCGCGRKKLVREADVKRGWGLFFSKSCKAKWQEKRTGQCAEYFHRQHRIDKWEGEYDPENENPFCSEALGQWLD